MVDTEPESNVTAFQPRELIEVDDELMHDIEDLVRSKSDFLLLNIIQDLYPADIAHIMNRLEIDQAEYGRTFRDCISGCCGNFHFPGISDVSSSVPLEVC